MADNKNKSVLIVDDIPNARTSLQITMSNLEFGKIRSVSGVNEAMDAIASNNLDVILCDYYMGDAADGQQFLEFLRSKNVIKSSTIFIMVTAEQGYNHVITAAECAPDDYLLKPFTGAAVMARLDRLFERNEVLKEVFKRYDAQDYDGTVTACNDVLASKSKFSMDALRLKGEAFLLSGRHQEAVDHFQKIVLARDLPWARLGLAKAYLGNNQLDKAEAATRSVIRDNPKYLAAYDFLSRILKRIGKKKESLAILQSAATISSNSMSRQRTIGAAALDAGELSVAENAMKSVIARNKNSPLREASDYAMLSNVMIEKGDAEQALSVIQDARASIKGVATLDRSMLASIEAIAHKRSGNAPAAKRALSDALANTHSFDGLSEELSLTLAKACIENGEFDQGMKLIKNVIQMNPDDLDKRASIKTSMLAAGVDEDRLEKLIDSSLAEVKDINNNGVLLAREGKFEEAFELLRAALERVPSNQQYISNAAAILLADLEKNGLDHTKYTEAKSQLSRLKEINPAHPRIKGLEDAMERITKKFDINGGL